MNYRVIALDLDGTLLNSEKRILPETLIALKQARQAGFEIIIATGRHHSAIHPIVQTLALTTPAICCNGTYLYDFHHQQVITGDPLSPIEATKLLNLLEQHNIEGLLYAGEAMYYRHPTRHVIRTEAWGQHYPLEQRPVFRQVDNLQQVIEGEEPLWKFAIAHADLTALDHFAHQATDSCDVTCDWSWNDQIDIAARGNSKGRRLKAWVESQGLTLEQVVAFGDNHNDISMLEAAGLGVAMAEADEQVKSAANRVIGSNEIPSIAEFICQQLL